jgi:hypothetical protein
VNPKSKIRSAKSDGRKKSEARSPKPEPENSPALFQNAVWILEFGLLSEVGDSDFGILFARAV